MPFDFSALMNNPMLQYSMGLLRAGGPSTTPHSFGQDLASANDYAQNAQLGNLKNDYLKAQTSEAQMKAKQLQAWQAMMGGSPDASQAPQAGMLAPQAAATQGQGVLAPQASAASSPMSGILSDPRIKAIAPMLAGMSPEDGMKVIATQILPAQAPSGYRNLPNGSMAAIPGGPADMFGTGNGLANNPSNLHGEDYLSTLPPRIASQVKALAAGRTQFPGGFALKSPYWQQIISAVSQYDPNFDAVNYNARANTRKDFTSGKSADNITSLNTAMAHLDTLKGNYRKLDNSNIPALNYVANGVLSSIGNTNKQMAMTNVGADTEAVSHELAKVFRAQGMSEGEVNAWKEKMGTSAGPAQSTALINSALDLMNGRLSALGERYNQGMGTTSDPIQLLSPDAQKAYNRLKGIAESKTDQGVLDPNAPSTSFDATSQVPQAILSGVGNSPAGQGILQGGGGQLPPVPAMPPQALGRSVVGRGQQGVTRSGIKYRVVQ